MTTEAAAEAPSGLLRALTIQRRVLWALLMREIITRFGRHNLGVLWLFGEPMLFTVGVTALWTLAGMHSGHGIPIAAFAITGYSSVLTWRNTVGRCAAALQSNANLLYHRNVRALDVFLTRILLEIGGTTISFVVLSILFSAIGWIAPPIDLGQVAAGWFMLAWFGGALGLTIGGLTAFGHIVERLWHPISYLLMPLSGAAFMVDWMSPTFQKLILLLPMVHGLELVREGYFGPVVKTHYDLPYMALCCLTLTLVGIYVIRVAGRRVGDAE